MSINIYKATNFENLETLCDKVYDLPTQIAALEKWLDLEGRNLPEGKYVVDIGFGMRQDATGGGGVLNAHAMKIMGQIGMDMYLSEYIDMK